MQTAGRKISPRRVNGRGENEVCWQEKEWKFWGLPDNMLDQQHQGHRGFLEMQELRPNASSTDPGASLTNPQGVHIHTKLGEPLHCNSGSDFAAHLN